jgi:type II secretory pathway pseudopilin PulG
LVVIGIIALLISILLPSLNKARESAKRVACASLLRQIGLAARSYAADNKDLLPIVNQDDGSATYDSSGAGVNFLRTIGFPLWGNTASNAGGTAFAGSGDEGVNDHGIPFNSLTALKPNVGSNIGRLSATNYLAGDLKKLMVCPSCDPETDLGTTTMNSHYLFNFHYKRVTAPGGTNGSPGYTRQRWKKLSQYGHDHGDTVSGYNIYSASVVNFSYGRDLALGIDPINFSNGGAGVSPHWAKNGRYYNVLYADCSVKTILLTTVGAIGSNGDTTRQNNGSIGPTLDQIGQIESVASGQAPLGFNGSYQNIPLDP